MEHGKACDSGQVCFTSRAYFVTEAPSFQAHKSIYIVLKLVKLTIRSKSNKTITVGECIGRAPIVPCAEV